MWEDVSQAWIRAGLNVDDCWKRACSVTNEWAYDASPGPLKNRIRERMTRAVPLQCRTLADILDPQPQAAVVRRRLNKGTFTRRYRKC